ncbi:sulfotransferase [Pedobacter sp. SYSU D00535]|uniref:sulfotransferase n=1 Tax=Pedobacter sp. SYSU D00535 TaxID=2810308 RepID=UPI001A9587FF|nr:sulfotransferase [Pedobacter sp. SYSU D00535]
MSTVKVLMILGMHRSGTSLLANWLMHLGLPLGEEFNPGGIGNVKGHFEDLKFLKLHMRALNERLWYQRNRIKPDFQIEGAALIREYNLKYEQWGWKDPRTCLFLPEWHTLLPDAKAIVIFRDFRQVVHSLRRRGQKEKLHRRRNLSAFIRKPLMALGTEELSEQIALQEWLRYNKAILSYLEKRTGEEFLVLEVGDMLKFSEQIFCHLTQEMGFCLRYENPENLYDAELLSNREEVLEVGEEILEDAEETLRLLRSKRIFSR